MVKKTFLLVKISSYNEKKEEAMEKMLHSLHRLLPQNAEISLEFESSNQFLKFYFVADPMYTSVISSQLYAEFPDAEVEEVKEYLPTDQQHIAFAQVKFKHASSSSFKTYKNLEENFLKALSAVMAKASPENRVFVQFALKKNGSKF